MALARWQHSVTDEAGNVIPHAYVEVRREAAGFPLAIPYADRSGASSAGNPVQADGDGFVAFHVIGGAYRIRIYAAGGFERILRYVGIGTAQEVDANTYATAGWSFELEAEVTAPPSAGAIRFDDVDLTAATKAWVDYDTLGGVSAAAMIAALDPGDKMVRNTVRFTSQGDGSDASWLVEAVTDHSTYLEIALDTSSQSGAATMGAGTVLSISREISGVDGVFGTPRGAYDAGTTYSRGDIVSDQAAAWIYFNDTPGSGHAPPTLPDIANEYWQQSSGPAPAIDPGDIVTEADAFTFDPAIHLYGMTRLDVATDVDVTLPADAEVGAGFMLTQVGAGRAHFVAAAGGDLSHDIEHTRTYGRWSVVMLYVESNAGDAANWVLAGGTTE